MNLEGVDVCHTFSNSDHARMAAVQRKVVDMFNNQTVNETAFDR